MLLKKLAKPPETSGLGAGYSGAVPEGGQGRSPRKILMVLSVILLIFNERKQEKNCKL